MARPSLIACTECARHMHGAELRCPHCGAARLDSAATSIGSKPQRAAIAVAMGLAVSVAELAACGDDTSTGAGGATSSSATNGSTHASTTSSTKASTASVSVSSSDVSSVAAYGVASTAVTGSSASGG